MPESFYWDEQRMINDMVSPSILAIGDSWFAYPFIGGSLTNYLGPIVNKKDHIILAKARNGAEAFDYVNGKYSKILLNTLRLYGSSLSAVFLSGGGNDFAGFNDLRPLLKDNCTREITAATCFRDGEDGLNGFLERMDEYYRKMIGTVYTHTSLDCVIVMHTYDYAIPNGQGLAGGQGWLQPALSDAGVPAALQRPCIALLIDSFHKMLTDIAAMDPKHLFVVNSCNTLNESDWANELHPTGNGFKKIAENKWKPVLIGLGLA